MTPLATARGARTMAPMTAPAASPQPAAPAFPPDWRWHHTHAATSLSAIEALFPNRFDLSRLDRPAIDRAGQMILATLQGGGKLLICGNGGSAAEAAHFSTELVGRYAVRPTWRDNHDTGIFTFRALRAFAEQEGFLKQA